MRLYSDLASWWPVLQPPELLAEEASAIGMLLSARSVLELGSGAGHLAANLPDVEVVLTDLSEAMLAVSRAQNPDREHVRGDMRSLRLGRTFDAVVLHDAVMYLTSPDDLAAAFATAAAHLAPGGRFLVRPDVVAETFEEGLDVGGGDDGDRSARLMEWTWDPDPADHTNQADFALLHRDGPVVRSFNESHTLALYDRATYWRHLRAAGLRPVEADPLLSASIGEVFLTAR